MFPLNITNFSNFVFHRYDITVSQKIEKCGIEKSDWAYKLSLKLAATIKPLTYISP